MQSIQKEKKIFCFINLGMFSDGGISVRWSVTLYSVRSQIEKVISIFHLFSSFYSVQNTTEWDGVTTQAYGLPISLYFIPHDCPYRQTQRLSYRYLKICSGLQVYHHFLCMRDMYTSHHFYTKTNVFLSYNIPSLVLKVSFSSNNSRLFFPSHLLHIIMVPKLLKMKIQNVF